MHYYGYNVAENGLYQPTYYYGPHGDVAADMQMLQCMSQAAHAQALHYTAGLAAARGLAQEVRDKRRPLHAAPARRHAQPLPAKPPPASGGFSLKQLKRRRQRFAMRPLPGDEPSLAEVALRCGGVAGPLALSQEHLGWDPFVHDALRRSFVSARSGAFSAEVLNEWRGMLLERIAWVRPSVKSPNGGEERRMPRSACWITCNGCACTYDYSGTAFAPEPMSPWLRNVTEEVCRACAIAERPNSCNANYYADGHETVGWHADDEALFMANKKDTLIISLSLGAPRIFELYPNDDPDTRTKIVLKDGDLCAMEGLCQKYYRHRIPSEESVREARINLTWRWIVNHQPQCPLFREV